MIRRSTWLMLVLLLLAAALYYYLQQPDNLLQQAMTGEATATNIPTGFLIAYEQGEVNEIRVSNSAGKSVKLTRTAAGWMITAGTEAPANQAAAEAAASQVRALRIVGVMETAPALNALGLEKPAYQLGVKFASGAESTFDIGDSTAIGDGYYVRAENGPVQIVSNYGLDALIQMLNTPPFMLTPTAPAVEPITELIPTSTP